MNSQKSYEFTEILYIYMAASRLFWQGQGMAGSHPNQAHRNSSANPDRIRIGSRRGLDTRHADSWRRGSFLNGVRPRTCRNSYLVPVSSQTLTFNGTKCGTQFSRGENKCDFAAEVRITKMAVRAGQPPRLAEGRSRSLPQILDRYFRPTMDF